MVDNYNPLKTRNSTKMLVLEECMTVYRKAHPEMDHMKISQDKITFEIAKFYLKGTKLELK